MGSTQKALNQIKKKKYCDPFLSDKRPVIMVGFGFNKAERNLVEFIPETVDKQSLIAETLRMGSVIPKTKRARKI